MLLNTRSLLVYISKYKLYLSIISIFAIFNTVVSLLIPLTVGSVIGSIFDQDGIQQINKITWIIILIFSFRAFITFIQFICLNILGEKILIDIRTIIFEHLLSLPIKFFDKGRVGDLLSRLSNDALFLKNILLEIYMSSISQLLTVVGSLYLMITISFRLTLFIVLVSPLTIFTNIYLGKFIRRFTLATQSKVSNLEIVVEETLHNIRNVKSYVREEYEVDRYKKALKTHFQTNRKLIFISGLYSPLTTYVAFSTLALIIWFGGKEVLADRLSEELLITFVLYGTMTVSSLSVLFSIIAKFQQATGVNKRLIEILDEPREYYSASEEKINEKYFHGHIRFEGVSFSYEDKLVLSNVSFDIQPKEIVGIIGESGVGKTTLINLLMGFYKCDAGHIYIDDVDIQELSVDLLRQNISIVSQDTFMFGEDIETNIKYGDLKGSFAQIKNAAILANAHEFILDLSDGYKSKTGDRGVRISGGQKQRINVARSFLRDVPILLLDEPMSNLDAENVKILQKSLQKLVSNRTTLIISHNMDLISMADKVFYLREGFLEEHVTHNVIGSDKYGIFAQKSKKNFQP